MFKKNTYFRKITERNKVHGEIKITINLRNNCNYSDPTLSLSYLITKSLKIKMHKPFTYQLFCVVVKCGCLNINKA